MIRVAFCCILLTSPAVADMPVCTGSNRAARKLTCIVDGDTGWEHGRKWRLLDIDAPEIGKPECEREDAIGLQSQDRLRALMANGYEVERSGRQDRSKRDLVRIRLADGQDAGDVRLAEDLAQPWPNEGNRWCSLPMMPR